MPDEGAVMEELAVSSKNPSRSEISRESMSLLPSPVVAISSRSLAFDQSDPKAAESSSWRWSAVVRCPDQGLES